MHKEVWKGWNTPRRLTVAGFLAPVIYILHCGICQDMPPVIIRFRNKDGGTRVVAKKNPQSERFTNNHYKSL
jgi:epoxyqueuosine reductase QueG